MAFPIGNKYGNQGKGRPEGSVNERTLVKNALKEMFTDPAFTPDIIDKIKKSVKDKGDLSAIKLILGEKFGLIDFIEDAESKEAQRATDVAVFALYNQLFDEQQQPFMSKKRTKLLMCSRRAGKTEDNIRIACKAAIEINNGRTTILSKSLKHAKSLYWLPIQTCLKNIGWKSTANGQASEIIVETGHTIAFGGLDKIDGIEALQGFPNDLVIYDEAQSHRKLKYAREAILGPTLADRGGTEIFSGTPPRIRGTYFEDLWLNAPDALRCSWNMFINPHILDPKAELARVLEQYKLNENDPLIQREYFGRIVYDDDALVFRFAEHNDHTDAELREWIALQPADDIRAICGLDLGYEDANAVCTIVYATHNPMLWCIHEQTVRRQSITDLVSIVSDAVSAGQRYTTYPVYVMADLGGLGKSIGMTLWHEYGLPIKAAEKQGKESAVEILGNLVKIGMLRVKPESLFKTDALKIVYVRDELDNITRLIDNDAYHSDIMDAVLYASRAAKGLIHD